MGRFLLVRCLPAVLPLLPMFAVGCGPSSSRSTIDATVPRGYVRRIQVYRNGVRVTIGPFVGYFFAPVEGTDLRRLRFVCFNEDGFYASDMAEGTLLFEGEAVLAVLPDAPPAVGGPGRLTPVFFSEAPASWLQTRPDPQDEFVHFHSGYDAAGPVATGYWLRHRAVAAFTYDMGGRVGADSPLHHRVDPGIDRSFPRIVEWDAGPPASSDVAVGR